MRCQECQKKLRKNQTVCPWCGTAQTQKGKKDDKAPAQVRLSAKGATKKRRLTDKQKKWIIGVAISVGAVLLALIITAVTLVIVWLGQINRESELSEGEIGINSALPDNDDVQNIALFGLDTRSDNESGRSDAIIILSIDRVHDKIKLTSIARDSLVAIDGYGESKITHAFGWGKAKLAVKTINQNFGMNITDYAYVNFFEFVELIDYIGGVMIDVSSSEANIMNNKYAPELNRLGLKYKPVKAGYQRLSGAQALAYSRDRYSGSDIDRGNRQKEVLEAMFKQVKDTPLTKYPSMISRVLSMCHTTLSNSEMLSIATWAIGSIPAFEQFNLPSSECKAQGGNWGDGHGWVWRYDMNLATQILHKFIYEEEAPAGVIVSPTRTYRPPTKATTTTTQSTVTADPTATVDPTGTTTTTGDAFGETTTVDPDTSTTTGDGTTDPTATEDGSTTVTDPDASTTTDGGATETTADEMTTTTTVAGPERPTRPTPPTPPAE